MMRRMNFYRKKHKETDIEFAEIVHNIIPRDLKTKGFFKRGRITRFEG